jgi:hypothetical protein
MMDPRLLATKAELQAGLALLHAEIKLDIETAKNEALKWMILVFGGQTIALLGALFAWTHPH